MSTCSGACELFTWPVVIAMRGTLAISGDMEGSLTEDEKRTLLLPPLSSSRLEREGGREEGREGRGREGGGGGGRQRKGGCEA